MHRGCVITIIAASLMILAVSLLYFFFFWPDVQRKGTSQCIYVIEMALEEFNKDFGSYPEGSNTEIAALLLGDNARDKDYIPNRKSVVVRDEEFVDFWKRPLRFETEGGIPKGLSAGRNGDFGDEDDITSQLVRDIIEASDEPEEEDDDSA